jgi:FkbM family methyltransferase
MSLLEHFLGPTRFRNFTIQDIKDSYLSRPLPPVMTPLGFRFGGLRSQHHRAMQTGTFEPAEVELFKRELSDPETILVDVGANAGYFTCLARSLGRRAIAIEPLPLNLRCLYANLEANGWMDTEVWPLAVSERPGLAPLWGASSTGASLIENWAGAPSAFRRMVPVTTLDTILASVRGKLLVKMDVEGHEYEALLGARETIKRGAKWLVEITTNEFHPSGGNPHHAETLALFEGYGSEHLGNFNYLFTPAR